MHNKNMPVTKEATTMVITKFTITEIVETNVQNVVVTIKNSPKGSTAK